MLDDPTTADEPTDEPDVVQSTPEPDEATPETTESAEEEAVVPPWGEDFDAERAWKTITHLRSREKELEAAAKEFDRLKSDPDAQAKFLEQLGYELADDTDTDDADAGADLEDDDEPLDPLEQRLARIEALEAQRAQEQQTQRLVQYVEREFDEIGGNLSDDQRTFVLNHARLLPFTPDGMPDIKSAHVAYLEHVAALKKEWAGTKKAASVSPVGTSGTQAPNLDDPQERHAWMQQRLAARNADS
jgi:hypothetical protein